MPVSEGQRILEAGVESLDLTLNQDQIRQLLEYLDLLLRWNKAYNLIADAPYPILVARHLLDSLSVLALLKGEFAVDMGTGAGLPGIPLAIAEPQRRWCLVDSAGKRIRFLRHVVRSLGLAQVQPVWSRMEQWQPNLNANQVSAITERGLDPKTMANPTTVEAIILRAVTSPLQALGWVQHLLSPGSALYLMMGRQGMQELKQLPTGFLLRSCGLFQL